MKTIRTFGAICIALLAASLLAATLPAHAQRVSAAAQQQAQRDGEVRVVVMLRDRSATDIAAAIGRLPGRAVAPKLHPRVRSDVDAVLSALPARARSKVLRRFERVPAFVVLTIEKSVKSLYEYIDRRKDEFIKFMDWVNRSPLAKTLNRGHLEILKEALKSPGQEFMAKQVAIDLGVSKNTARNYLAALADKDLLVLAQSKRGKARIYIAPANLKARLEL